MARFYTYDNKADIEKCLSCTKKSCINCLGNFYSANEKAEELDEKDEVNHEFGI